MNQGKNRPPAHGSTQSRGQTVKSRSHQPGVAQPQMTGAPQPPKLPAAPPVYRPQSLPRVLQTKTTATATAPPARQRAPANAVAVAPPAYRPQPVPKALQTKTVSAAQPSPKGQTPRRPVAPPVYRPQARKIVQPKMAGAEVFKPPQAPAVYRPQPAPRVLQAKISPARAAAPARYHRAMPQWQSPLGREPQHAMRHKTKTPPFSPARGLVQAFIIEDVNTPGTYVSDGGRPGSHLNKFTVEALAEEIIANAPLNDVEKELVTDPVNANNGWDETDVVNNMRKNNLLSQGAFAVCHKIPYASFEKVLLSYISKGISSQVGLQNLSDLMHAAEGINHGVAGQWHSSVKNFGTAIAGQVNKNIISTSRTLLNEFDGASDNLYFGFATTNSSIGQSADLHYNILSVGVLPEAPTPRGANLLLLLNACESQLGLSQTTQTVWAGNWALPGKWVMTSGAHGKKKQSSGMVLSS